MNKFMEAATEEASQGLREKGIPVGAALENDGAIIGRGHNKRVQESNPIAHAEGPIASSMPEGSDLMRAQAYTRHSCHAS